jgi:hypothetical protein
VIGIASSLISTFGEFAPLVAGYRPFLDPLDAHSWWLALSLPLLLGISMIYKAVRLPSLRFYWRQVVKMTVQLTALLVVMCVGLYVLVEVALPHM